MLWLRFKTHFSVQKEAIPINVAFSVSVLLIHWDCYNIWLFTLRKKSHLNSKCHLDSQSVNASVMCPVEEILHREDGLVVTLRTRDRAVPGSNPARTVRIFWAENSSHICSSSPRCINGGVCSRLPFPKQDISMYAA